MLVSKVLVESKNKTYACMTCGKQITLKKNPDVNYSSHYPKKWLKFNMDGSEHDHKKKKVAKPQTKDGEFIFNSSW